MFEINNYLKIMLLIADNGYKNIKKIFLENR